MLDETVRVIRRLVAQAQSDGRVPTLAVGVARGGSLIHLRRVGAQPIEADTQFRIGSITKTMTATLVLQLHEQGQVALDDPLTRYVPELPVGAVTIRQLLGHAAGLQREPDGRWWERASGQDLSTLLATVGPAQLTRPPYHGHHYSNLAYGLLGAVLERVSGQTWWSLAEQRLLGPLGLHRTSYSPQEPFARGYVVHPWHGTLREEPRYDSGAMAPAGQLWSTLSDLARWADFLARPDPAVLAAASLDQMCVPVAIRDPHAWTAGHGLGLALWRHRERVYVGHAGSMPGYLAVVVVDRPTGTAVVAAADAYTVTGGGLSELAIGTLTTVLDREPPAPPPWRPAAHAPPPEIAELCGGWWWMGREFTLSWHGDADELVMSSVTVPGGATRFRPDSDGAGFDRWRGVAGPDDGEILRVLRDPDHGGVVGLEVATLRFHRAPTDHG
ncbi:beta-lactamase family protein [Natronosporangium hydrolyticum]|uniref:Beta-lactamase family protein n=1 Tax=Natronosporangium hydrolyticum TaxID=2811111 RepID=A0A895YTC8_9ACTN|nr:beta-lactamase family protein [Natronosporangium hydrolyticum]